MYRNLYHQMMHKTYTLPDIVGLKKLLERFVFGGRAPTFWRASKFLGGPVSFQIYRRRVVIE